MTDDDLTSQVAHALHEETGVHPDFASLWADLFTARAALAPPAPGETIGEWAAGLARETSAEIQALCAEFLTDRDAFRRLASALAVAAKAEVGHRHTRKPWGEISSGAKGLIEMKQSRKGDNE